MQIHKQKFDIFRGGQDKLRLDLPKGSRVLRVSKQYDGDDATFVWYSTKEPDMHGSEVLTVHAIGTGHEFPSSFLPFYIGTEIYHRGQLVLHFFAVPERIPV